MMEHYTTNPLMEEWNAGIAGLVSLVANTLLIRLTSKVKMYSETVRYSQYYSCTIRLAFSGLVVLTAPTIMYITEVKALYVVKGGIYVPRQIADYLLNLFLVFIVTFCTGPTVQCLQVAYLLSNPTLKNHMISKTLIGLIPLIVAIPTFWLIYFGYMPTQYEVELSESLIQEITRYEESCFLIAEEEKIFTPETGTYEYDVMARICTFFMFLTMISSAIVVIVCFSHMHTTRLKNKLVCSPQSAKTQKQLNVLLMVQFIFPFITIHIPFYTAFMLPYLDFEFKMLSSYLPYLFAWCPAINPILVICMVKNVRDILIRREKTSVAGTTFSNALHVRNPATSGRYNRNEIDRLGKSKGNVF